MSSSGWRPGRIKEFIAQCLNQNHAMDRKIGIFAQPIEKNPPTLSLAQLYESPKKLGGGEKA